MGLLRRIELVFDHDENDVYHRVSSASVTAVIGSPVYEYGSD